MANFSTFSTCNRNPGPPRSSSPGGIEPVRPIPDFDCLVVLGLLAQQCECPVYCLLKCVRLDVLVSLDPVPLVQEIAAVNAHGGPPSETLGCARLRPNAQGPKGRRRSSPVDIGDNWSVGLFSHQRRDKAQEGLMLWVQRPTHEKGADVEVGLMTARRRVRFMPDEYSLGLGVPA